MPLLNTADAVYVGDTLADRVYVGDTLVWEAEAAPFAPDDLTNLGLWYDAQALALADATVITTLTDQGPLGLNATVTAGGAVYDADGLNAHPSMRFDADYYDTAEFTPWTGILTVFIVAAFDDRTASMALFDGPAEGERLGFWKSATNATDAWGLMRNSILYSANGTADASPHLFRAKYAVGAGSSLHVDGVESIASVNVGAAAVHHLRFGGRFDNAGLTYGHVGEILMYTRALDAGEIADVETYLTSKWSL